MAEPLPPQHNPQEIEGPPCRSWSGQGCFRADAAPAARIDRLAAGGAKERAAREGAA